MIQYHYTARWARDGKPSIASVSFTAASNNRAIMKADRIARQLGVTHTPRTITGERGLLIECINKGVSK